MIPGNAQPCSGVGPIHHIRSLVALLENFVDARNIDSKMAGNLRELLSFAAVGSDRLMRRRAAGVRC